MKTNIKIFVILILSSFYACQKDTITKSGETLFLEKDPSVDHTASTQKRGSRDNVSMINDFFASNSFTNFRENWEPEAYSVNPAEIRKASIKSNSTITIYGFNIVGPAGDEASSIKLFAVNQDGIWNGFVSRRYNEDDLIVSPLGNGSPEDPIGGYKVNKGCRALGGTCSDCTNTFNDCHGCAWGELLDDWRTTILCISNPWSCEAAVLLHCSFGMALDLSNINFHILAINPKHIVL